MGEGSYIFTAVVLAQIVPQSRASQVFAMSTTTSRLSGFLGPFVFAQICAKSGDVATGYYSLAGILVLALLCFFFVHVDERYEAVGDGEIKQTHSFGSRFRPRLSLSFPTFQLGENEAAQCGMQRSELISELS